ncbi:hypothetical protein D3C87_1363070 [compost metagenome]
MIFPPQRFVANTVSVPAVAQFVGQLAVLKQSTVVDPKLQVAPLMPAPLSVATRAEAEAALRLNVKVGDWIPEAEQSSDTAS